MCESDIHKNVQALSWITSLPRLLMARVPAKMAGMNQDVKTVDSPTQGAEIHVGTSNDQVILWDNLDAVCLDDGGLLSLIGDSIKLIQDSLENADEINCPELHLALKSAQEQLSRTRLHLDRVLEILSEASCTKTVEPPGLVLAGIENSPILSAKQVADLLGCSVSTVLSRSNRGELAGKKYGKSWAFPKAAFIERLNEIAKAEAAERLAKFNMPHPLTPPIRKERRRVVRAFPGFVSQQKD